MIIDLRMQRAAGEMIQSVSFTRYYFKLSIFFFFLIAFPFSYTLGILPVFFALISFIHLFLLLISNFDVIFIVYTFTLIINV